MLNLDQKSTLELFREETAGCGGKIFLYGAGKMVYDALPCMEQCGFQIEGIIDQDPQKHGRRVQGIPIVSLEAAVPKLKNCAAAITTEKYADEIIRCLQEYLPRRRIFRTSMYPLGAVRGRSILQLREFLSKHLEELDMVRAMLADEESKVTLDAVLDSWLRFQGDKLYKYITLPQYFIPEVVNSIGEKPCMVDAGAYIGDTIAEAVQIIPDIQQVYAFEADPVNYMELKRQYGSNCHVVTQQLALSDKLGTACFTVGYNCTSRTTGHYLDKTLSTEELPTVKTVPLDYALRNVTDRISMIKIDVEGGEMAVLRGAEQRIRRDHPVIAVCVYHQNQDVLEIPLLLHKISPDYRFYFRQHSIHGTDAVLYAVR